MGLFPLVLDDELLGSTGVVFGFKLDDIGKRDGIDVGTSTFEVR